MLNTQLLRPGLFRIAVAGAKYHIPEQKVAAVIVICLRHFHRMMPAVHFTNAEYPAERAELEIDVCVLEQAVQ